MVSLPLCLCLSVSLHVLPHSLYHSLLTFCLFKCEICFSFVILSIFRHYTFFLYDVLDVPSSALVDISVPISVLTWVLKTHVCVFIQCWIRWRTHQRRLVLYSWGSWFSYSRQPIGVQRKFQSYCWVWFMFLLYVVLLDGSIDCYYCVHTVLVIKCPVLIDWALLLPFASLWHSRVDLLYIWVIQLYCICDVLYTFGFMLRV